MKNRSLNVRKDPNEWMKYLTAEEKALLRKLPDPSRGRTDIKAACWARLRSGNKEARKDDPDGHVEPNLLKHRDLDKEIITNSRQEFIDSLDLNNVERVGDQKYDEDWSLYLRGNERDLLENLGPNHPQSVAIRFKCIARRTYFKRKEEGKIPGVNPVTTRRTKIEVEEKPKKGRNYPSGDATPWETFLTEEEKQTMQGLKKISPLYEKIRNNCYARKSAKLAKDRMEVEGKNID